MRVPKPIRDQVRPLQAMEAAQGRAAAQGEAAAQEEAIAEPPPPRQGAGLGAVLAALGAGIDAPLGGSGCAFWGWGLGLADSFILAFRGSALERGRYFSLLGLGAFLFFAFAFRRGYFGGMASGTGATPKMEGRPAMGAFIGGGYPKKGTFAGGRGLLARVSKCQRSASDGHIWGAMLGAGG